LNETRFGPKNKSSPNNISRPKKSWHFLMHWTSVKLPDNFQMREHSWPCRFHINKRLNKFKNKWLLLHTGSEFQWYRTYERGYKTSGSPLHFMLRRSSLIECVSVMREHSWPCRFHINFGNYGIIAILGYIKMIHVLKLLMWKLLCYYTQVPGFSGIWRTREGTRLQDHLCALSFMWRRSSLH
jgi:hypothetical protein